MPSAILQYAAAHQDALLLAGGFALTAFASTFPEKRPRTLDDLWEWAHSFVTQIGNARRPTIPKP